jgi:hypothetical protein
MRTEIEKYCLRANTANELVKMWLAHYGVLTYSFPYSRCIIKAKKHMDNQLYS